MSVAAPLRTSSATTTTATAGAVGVAIQVVFGTVMAINAVRETQHLPEYDMDKSTGLTVVNAAAKSTACAVVAFAPAVLGPLGLAAGLVFSLCLYGLWNWGESIFSVQRKKHMEHCCRVLGCGPDDTMEVVDKLIRKKKAQFHPDRQAESQRAFDEVAAAIIAYSRLRGWDSDADLMRRAGSATTWAGRSIEALRQAFATVAQLATIRGGVLPTLHYVRDVICVAADARVPSGAKPLLGDHDGSWAKFDATRARCPLGLRVVYTNDPAEAFTSFEVRRNEDGVVVGFTTHITAGKERIGQLAVMTEKPDTCMQSHQLYGRGPWLVAYASTEPTTESGAAA